MNPIKVFLTVTFIAGIALCVLAALSNQGVLYSVGAVISLLTAGTALTGTLINQLLEGEKK